MKESLIHIHQEQILKFLKYKSMETLSPKNNYVKVLLSKMKLLENQIQIPLEISMDLLNIKYRLYFVVSDLKIEKDILSGKIKFDTSSKRSIIDRIWPFIVPFFKNNIESKFPIRLEKDLFTVDLQKIIQNKIGEFPYHIKAINISNEVIDILFN